MSRALKPTGQWYSAYERELAAIAYCFIQWRHSLEGCPGGVTVMTDHKPLTLLMDQQVLSRSQTRWIWLGLFQSIQPKITYQPRSILSQMHSQGADPKFKLNPRNKTRSSSRTDYVQLKAKNQKIRDFFLQRHCLRVWRKLSSR